MFQWQIGLLAQYYNLHRNVSLTRAETAESVYRIVDNSFHLTTSERLTNQTLRLVANATFGRYMLNPANTFETGRVVSKLQEVAILSSPFQSSVYSRSRPI